jgi:hypothetical protein
LFREEGVGERSGSPTYDAALTERVWLPLWMQGLYIFTPKMAESVCRHDFVCYLLQISYAAFLACLNLRHSINGAVQIAS